MAVQREDFTLALVSNEGVSEGSTNTTFTCKLGDRVHLDKGAWSVGIQELSMPRYVDTIHYDKGRMAITITWFTKKDRLGITVIPMPKYGCMMNGEQILTHITSHNNFTQARTRFLTETGSVEGYIDLNRVLRLQWCPPTGKFQIIVNENPYSVQRVIILLPSALNRASLTRKGPTLGNLLGSAIKSVWQGIYVVHAVKESFTEFALPCNTLKHMEYMDVRCSLAGNDGIRGSGSLGYYPLAAWVTEDTGQGSVIHKQPKHIHYIPCSVKEFSSVSVSLQNLWGRELNIDPKMGCTTLLLSFKRVVVVKAAHHRGTS